MRAIALRLPVMAVLASACAGASRVPQPEQEQPPEQQPTEQQPPEQQPEQDCGAQVCHGDDGGCDMVVLEGVWIWNGQACVEAYDSGCARVGPDCDQLYTSQAECEAAWSRCRQ